ncbi:MAG: hypothetical protein L0I86_04675, partial [Enterobacterales bacterium]|nr:hypothetical protein [Enterobacterales bacterium]
VMVLASFDGVTGFVSATGKVGVALGELLVVVVVPVVAVVAVDPELVGGVLVDVPVVVAVGVLGRVFWELFLILVAKMSFLLAVM